MSGTAEVFLLVLLLLLVAELILIEGMLEVVDCKEDYYALIF